MPNVGSTGREPSHSIEGKEGHGFHSRCLWGLKVSFWSPPIQSPYSFLYNKLAPKKPVSWCTINDFTWFAKAPQNSLLKTQVHIAMETLSCQQNKINTQELFSSSIQTVESVCVGVCRHILTYTCTHMYTHTHAHTTWKKSAVYAHPLNFRPTEGRLF